MTEVATGVAAHNIIGGSRVGAHGGATFTSYNPAHSSEVIGVFPRSTAEDVADAVSAAKAAASFWKGTPWPTRGEVILQAALLLKERKEELANLMTQEMGKVLTEARGDVQEAIDMGFYIAGAARRPFGETVPSELRRKWAMTYRAPLGVVGIITPWNFPMAIPSWKIFPALLAGNAIVFKPAEDTPLCALRFAEILFEAGLPEGVLNVVFGTGEEAGEALVRHPDVASISFTGSGEVGRHVAEICGGRLARCSLELGGKNAIIIASDADIELAVDGAIWGAYGTTGQRCTATSRLIVDRSRVDEVTQKLLARIGKLRLGDGLDEKVSVGPLINEKQLKRVHSYTEVGTKEGAHLVTGGDYARDGALADGFFYAPTLFCDVKPSMRIAQEEIFGPTLSLIPVDGFEAAIEAANSTAYGLSLSLYSRDVERAFVGISELDAGIVYINAPTIGAEIQLPFGGIKQTGNGHREAGTVALDQFSEWRSVYIDYSGHLQRAQIDT